MKQSPTVLAGGNQYNTIPLLAKPPIFWFY